MRDQTESRLRELKREFETGQARLHTLQAEAAQVQETLLRISGAVIALEELLNPAEENDGRPRAAMPGAEQPAESASTAA